MITETIDRDRWGVAVGATSRDALSHLDAAVEDLVSLAGEPASHARMALDADPDLALARIFLAYLDLYATTREAQASARAGLAPLLDTRGSLPARERAHLRAALAWADGELEDATRAWEEALLFDPRDLLALKVAQDVYFFLGDLTNLRDVAERVLPAWPEGSIGWGWVQGIAAFGAEENGDYPLAQRRVDAALAADRTDVWAVHAGAHVLEMQGRAREGLDFLDRTSPHWGRSYFAIHNWWHYGLFLIEVGDHAAAVDLYDQRIRTERFETWLDVVDASSLLWRLALVGVEVVGRATELMALVEPRGDEGISAFNDLHLAMVFGLAGRVDLARGLLTGGDGGVAARPGAGTNARVAGEVGLALIAAFADFADGDTAGAAEILADHRRGARLIGGSNAQRDVIDLTLLAAAAGSGQSALVRALQAERRARKPTAEDAADLLVAVATVGRRIQAG